MENKEYRDYKQLPMSASQSITVSTRRNTEKTMLAQNNKHMKK